MIGRVAQARSAVSRRLPPGSETIRQPREGRMAAGGEGRTMTLGALSGFRLGSAAGVLVGGLLR